MRKLIVSLVVAGGFAVTTVGTAAADQIVIDLPHNVITNGTPGNVYPLTAPVPVPVEDRGLECSGELVSQNNTSVHPGNDVRVTSGTSSVTLTDVEGSPDKTTPLATPLTLGADIRVELLMGDDGIYSGAFHLELECVQPVPPPTPPTTPTTAPTVPTVTVTVPTEVGSQGGVATPAVIPATPTTAVSQTPSAATPAAPNPGVATAAVPSGGQLPATGPDRTDVALALGAVLVGAGFTLTALSRRPGRA